MPLAFAVVPAFNFAKTLPATLNALRFAPHVIRKTVFADIGYRPEARDWNFDETFRQSLTTAVAALALCLAGPLAIDEMNARGGTKT